MEVNINLNEYVENVLDEYRKLTGKEKYVYDTFTDAEAFTVIQFACQLYNADHINQNVTASMDLKSI